MGQYYAIVNIDKCESLHPHRDFKEAAKLMEHSFIGNAMTLAVADLLSSSWAGDRVVWAGDYAEQEDEPFHDFEGHDGDNLYRQDYPAPRFDAAYGQGVRYFVNLDKKQYIDIEDATVEEYGLRIHAFPLLVATSNGQGGGDYYATAGKDLVGSWKGDHIRAYAPGEAFLIDKELFGWEHIVPGFTERRRKLPDGLTYDYVGPSDDDIFTSLYDVRFKGDLINHILRRSPDTGDVSPAPISTRDRPYEPFETVLMDEMREGIRGLVRNGALRWVNQWNEIPTPAVTRVARAAGYEVLAGEPGDGPWLTMWGDMWTFKNHLDATWARKNPGAFAAAGLVLFDVQEIGLVFGIDAAGYEFLDDHFVPLYIERGHPWHPVDPALVASIESYFAVKA